MKVIAGCAAFISLDQCPILYKNWAAIDMQQSSTWRELQCVNFTLDSFKNLLSSCNVKWFTDNQCVPKILEGGSTKEHLQKIAIEIYYCTRKNNISLEVECVPRNENEKADYISKVIDFDDWRVKDKYFQAATAHWGLSTIDCFASYQNKKVPKFFVHFACACFKVSRCFSCASLTFSSVLAFTDEH